MPPPLYVHKDGLHLRVFPLFKQSKAALISELTYDYRKYLATRQQQLEAGDRRILQEAVECYDFVSFQGQEQLVTHAGYLPRIRNVAARLKREVILEDLNPLRKEAYYFDPRPLANFKFRPEQLPTVTCTRDLERGQIVWPTGSGKGMFIVWLCLMYPKARILVVTKHTDVLRDRYRDIRPFIPDVGIYCSKQKMTTGRQRVVCVSTGCLPHYYSFAPDIVIADEVHELATEGAFVHMGKFRHCRMFGLSANRPGDRFDGADFENIGMFGEVIRELSYQEGVDLGLIVPLYVHWRHVDNGHNPCENYDGIRKRQAGIWANNYRNWLISNDARRFPDDQVLITVKTVEHAMRLKQMLPEFTVVYDKMEPKLRSYLIRQGVISPDFVPLQTHQRDKIKEAFERGDLNRVIATGVWNRGVNFQRLQVLIRADAGASKINDTQIPGRLSRLCFELGKTHGILIDYLDEFDDSLYGNAISRKKVYREKKWQQILPEHDTLLPKLRPKLPRL